MNSFKKKLQTLAVGAALGAGVTAAMLPAVAHADLSWQYNNAAANAAEGYVPVGLFAMPALSNPMDSLTFTAESILVWHGTPFAPGSTFSDFIVVKINSYRLGLNEVQHVPTYGQGAFPPALAGDHQLTLVVKANGVQLTPTQYAVVAAGFSMNWYWDSGCDPSLSVVCAPGIVPYTYTDFSTLTEVNDGTVVETSNFVLGSGVNTAFPSALPDGTIDLVVTMVDQLGTPASGPPDFELMTGTFALSNVLGVTAGNNALCKDQGGTRVCTTVANGSFAPNDLVGFFIADILASGPVTAIIHTQTEGSFIKLAVPEPGTLALLGLGLAGLGFGASRRRKVAA